MSFTRLVSVLLGLVVSATWIHLAVEFARVGARGMDLALPSLIAIGGLMGSVWHLLRPGRPGASLLALTCVLSLALGIGISAQGSQIEDVILIFTGVLTPVLLLLDARFTHASGRKNASV